MSSNNPPVARPWFLVVAVLAALAFLAAACSDPDTEALPTTTTAADRNAREPGEPLRTVVLGDSIVAGGGAAPYREDVPQCFRSARSWPMRLVEFLDERADAADGSDGEDGSSTPLRLEIVDDLSCGGATIDEFLGPWDERDQPPQIHEEPQEDVDVALFSVGGNDLNILLGLIACVQADCASGDPEALEENFASFEDTLVDELYPAMHEAYPRATLVHVNYFRFVVPPGVDAIGCRWLTEEEQEAIAAVGVRLKEVVEDAAARFDAGLVADGAESGRIVALDVEDSLDGHELCSEAPLVHRMGTADQGHPTALGYEAIAETVADRLPAALGR